MGNGRCDGGCWELELALGGDGDKSRRRRDLCISEMKRRSVGVSQPSALHQDAAARPGRTGRVK